MSDKPTEDRQRLNGLSEKLEAAIQKRRETDREQKRQQQLEAMRNALKAGRDERREDRSILDGYFSELSPCVLPEDRATAKYILNEAKGRNMLAQFREKGADGKERVVDLAEIKQKESYEKRPSVRASKKARSKSRGMSM